MAEDEMVREHHLLNGPESEQTLGNSERQGSLACCSPLFIDFVLFQFPLVSFNLNVTLPYFVLHDIDIFEDCMSFNLGFVDLMF